MTSLTAGQMMLAAALIIGIATARARVHVQGKPSLIASITPEAIAALDLRIGTNVWLRVMRAELQAYAGMPVAQHRSDSHPNG